MHFSTNKLALPSDLSYIEDNEFVHITDPANDLTEKLACRNFWSCYDNSFVQHDAESQLASGFERFLTPMLRRQPPC